MANNSPNGSFHIEHHRGPLLYRARYFLCKLPGVCIDPSDAVQEALLKAQRNLGQCDGGTEAERFAWLRKILDNLLVDLLRQGKHDPAPLRDLIDKLGLSSVVLDTIVGADHTTPLDHLLKKERERRLMVALSQLPEVEGTAVAMRYLDDPPASLADIGARLGRTPKAAAGVLARGLTRLRELLQDTTSRDPKR
jgi:RNA polymerase sigma factor (sigma-70 family)